MIYEGPLVDGREVTAVRSAVLSVQLSASGSNKQSSSASGLTAR